VGDHGLGTLEDRHLEAQLDTRLSTGEATALTGRTTFHSTSRRLGLRRMGGVDEALRAGIVWSEILGPPRALRGPHRPPRLQIR
jgi:hypothetical protein